MNCRTLLRFFFLNKFSQILKWFYISDHQDSKDYLPNYDLYTVEPCVSVLKIFWLAYWIFIHIFVRASDFSMPRSRNQYELGFRINVCPRDSGSTSKFLNVVAQGFYETVGHHYAVTCSTYTL